MYVVVKPFKTAIRRFAIDDPVSPVEAEQGGNMSFADLKERGFIKASRVSYDTLSRPDLDALAAERGLDISTAKTKADVVAIIEHSEKAEEAVQTGHYETLLKSDLERLAAERGLDASHAKNKSDLVALLHAADKAIAAV